MYLEEIVDNIQLENDRFECKAVLNRDDVVGWLKTIAGFANASGGEFYIGVKDKTNQLVGFDRKAADNERNYFNNQVNEHLTPRPQMNISFIRYEANKNERFVIRISVMSISEIFDEFGEAYFRNLESNTLIELQKRKQTIVSCGGGVVMREENADHMKKNGRVVLLTAKPETIYERVKDSDERPILNGNMNVEYISGLMEKRKERYEAVADVTVATDGKNVTQICEEIIAKLIALDNEQDNKQA